MPLPFLILGGIALLGGVMGAAANSVNRDYEMELNSINRKIEETVEEVQRSYKRTEKVTRQAIKRFEQRCEAIQSTSFRRFAETFSALKHVEKDAEFSPTVLKKVQEITIHYQTNGRSQLSAQSQESVERTGAVVGIAATMAFGAIGGGIFLVGQAIKGVKLQMAIDEAKTELARVKARAEEVRTAERHLNLIRRRTEEMDEVCQTLDKLFGLSLDRLEAVIAEAGTDFRRYSNEQKQAVKVSYHFFDALQQIMAAPLIDPSNRLTRASEEALQKARQLVQVVEAL